MRKIAKRKWLFIIVAIVIFFLIMCNLLCYIVDPFFQYRVKDNQYVVSSMHCGPGLIKNYDYDTIIIGSSVTQNFDMDLFRTEFNCSPLHIGIGAISDEEMAEYVLLANKVGKADTYYLCIDIASFRKYEESKTMPWLMKDDLLSRMQYSLSYESLFRLMPIDIVFTAVTKLGFSLPASYEYNMKIDRYGYWGHQYVYGTDVVLDGRKTGVYSVSEVDTTNLYEKMVEGIDTFFAQLDLSNADYNFFFPPYSSLFWCDAQEDGYFDTYLDAKEYFVKKATESGVTVYDFQGAELTTDLDNYRDTVHYSPELNDWMTVCFSHKQNIVTPDNYSEYRKNLVNNTEDFRKKFTYLFE